MTKYREKFSDNIWFTRKARIHSAERLKNDHTHTQLFLIEYALIAAILSVVSLRYSNFLGLDTDIFITIMSIVVLVLSLVITNFDMKERSNKFYQNYIQLQTLYLETKELENNNKSLTSTREKYQSLLLEVENHLPIDDICARVESAKTLYSRIPTKYEYIRCYAYKTVRYSFLFIIYFMPIALIYFY